MQPETIQRIVIGRRMLSGFGGNLTIRTQVNVGYSNQPGILTLTSTNGTYSLILKYDTDGALLIQAASPDSFDIPAIRVQPTTALTQGNIQDWRNGSDLMGSLENDGTLFVRRIFAVQDSIPNGDEFVRIQQGSILIHPDLATNNISIDALFNAITMWQNGQTNFYVAPNSGWDDSTNKALTPHGIYVPISGGGGDSIWTNNNGGISATISSVPLSATFTTNALYIGTNTIPHWSQQDSDSIINIHDSTKGDSTNYDAYIAVYDGSSDRGFEVSGNVNRAAMTSGGNQGRLAFLSDPIQTTLSIEGADEGLGGRSILFDAKESSTNPYALFVLNTNTTFSVSKNSGYTSTGQKVFTDKGTFQFPGGIVLSNVTTIATNLAATTTDIYTIPANTKAFIQGMVGSTNSSPGTFLLNVKISGNYYQLSAGAQTVQTNATALSQTQPFVFEPGDTVAVTTTQPGVAVYISAMLIPTNAFVKTYRAAPLASGDTTLYTVPSGHMAIGNNALFGFSSSLVTTVSHTTGGGLTISRYLNDVPTSIGTVSNGTGVNAQMMWLAAGDVVKINAASSTADLFAWLTVYEAPLE